jgi:hypothetical protein
MCCYTSSSLRGNGDEAVVAKSSASGTRGWRATTAIAVLLLCAAVIAGCSSGGGRGGSAPGGVSRDPGRSASPASPSPSACAPWAGLDDLSNITTWLRQMIGDEVIFGAGTQQAKRDGLAVVVYAESLGGLGAELPARYALDLRTSVLSVAASPYKQTPEQLNTAANAAQTLAARISQLCL